MPRNCQINQNMLHSRPQSLLLRPAIMDQTLINLLQTTQVPSLPYTLKQLATVNKAEFCTENILIQLELSLSLPILLQQSLINDIQSQLTNLYPNHQTKIEINHKIQPHGHKSQCQPIQQVKNVIAIASGKGGVGKSTTAVNLALAMASQGARVGILDADIYGPNQPHMLGTEQPPAAKSKQFTPVMAHGIQSMSIGYLIDTTTPMIWRGPMISKALQQLMYETLWDNLDYLFIDLPPGTGDIQLTLTQKIPVTGAVIVTTPQDIALLDARKGLEMFNKVDVPALGIVENMSHYVCPHCQHEEAIFGQGGGEQMAKTCKVDLLGQIPLTMNLRQAQDNGQPLTVSEPRSSIAQTYQQIALIIAAKIGLQPINYAAKFPKIVVE